MRVLFFLVLLFFTSQCIEPYQPTVNSTNLHYLVIDSFANLPDGSVSVTLSRTSALSSSDKLYPEPGASVQLEDDKGGNFPLFEKEKGVYSLLAQGLSLANQYRLRIKTAFDKEYVSEFIKPKETPSIDSVRWRPSPDGIKISLDTHDPSANSRYYHWNYLETWEYYSHFSSAYEVTNGSIVPRALSDQIHQCWNTESSDHILIGSSIKLLQDQISHQLISVIPAGSQKLLIRYSIMITQQSITAEEYAYWQELQKTTESLGGLFDPLPTQVTGNFHCTGDRTEPVIGYFSAGTISKKRIFISFNELPSYLQFGPTEPPCELQELSRDYFLANMYVYPIVDIKANGGSFVVSTPYCVDCRTQGGANAKPDFW